VRIWDPGIGQPVGDPLKRPLRPGDGSGGGSASAVGEVIISGGADTTVQIWDPGSGQPIGGRDVIVSGGADATMRFWDTSRTIVAIVDVLGPVQAVGVTADGAVCAAADRALCLFATHS
jgi:WD40 repeat protein